MFDYSRQSEFPSRLQAVLEAIVHRTKPEPPKSLSGLRQKPTFLTKTESLLLQSLERSEAKHKTKIEAEESNVVVAEDRRQIPTAPASIYQYISQAFKTIGVCVYCDGPTGDYIFTLEDKSVRLNFSYLAFMSDDMHYCLGRIYKDFEKLFNEKQQQQLDEKVQRREEFYEKIVNSV